VRRHETALWWFHSSYALAIGIGVMWLGSRNPAYLRLAIFHVAFIWLTSLVAPILLARAQRGSVWSGRARLFINYLNRNFYQQILFFLLPIYYASSTWGSANFVFVAFLAISAAMSTLDILYDRHLSVRRWLSALFFAFNLFACVNVMLPVVWRIGNAAALWGSAALALVAFATIAYRLGDLASARVRLILVAAAVLLTATVRWGAFLIPPAPLKLSAAAIGTDLNTTTLELGAPLKSVPAGWSGSLYALTAVQAPYGLADSIGHRWIVDGREVHRSRLVVVRGGRRDGYRLWTRSSLTRAPAGARVAVDVVTGAGQLIGRAAIRVVAADSF
jgi:hypothetical protein